MYQKNIIMPGQNINQEFRLNKIDEIRKYLMEEINWNELRRNKRKTIWRALNYIDHGLIIISTITGFVSISAFASLVGITIESTSSAMELKICVITAGIKNYKSVNKKKKHDKIVL